VVGAPGCVWVLVILKAAMFGLFGGLLLAGGGRFGDGGTSGCALIDTLGTSGLERRSLSECGQQTQAPKNDANTHEP